MSPTSQREYLMQIEALRRELARQTKLAEEWHKTYVEGKRKKDAMEAELADLKDQITEVPTLMRKLASSQAREAQLRDALSKINKAYDGVSDGIQDDLENGVKWLNQEAARKFNREYPGVVKALDILLDASITADEALALPQDDTALKQYGAKLLRDAADGCIDDNEEYKLNRRADKLEGKK